MSLGLDPIVASLFYSLNLIPHFRKPSRGAPQGDRPSAPMPFVSVLVTFCRESRADIGMTVSSLIRQTYPKDKLEVVMAIEPDDDPVAGYVQEAVSELRRAGIEGRVVVSDGKVRIKPHALNLAIRAARGAYCAFYDAADEIEADQIEKAILLMMERDYDVAQAAVFREGASILSRFLLIDTVFWYRKYLPFLLSLARGFPLSGEGLFIKRGVLDQAGGFPEVLTEDAYLGIVLSEGGRRFGIVDSVVVEKAPRNVRAHFTQRSRWQRGYLTCLRRLFRSSLSFRRKLVLLLPFIAPVTCAVAFLGWSLILLRELAFYLTGAAWFHGLGLSVEQPALDRLVYYWTLALGWVGIPVILASYAHALASEKKWRHARVLPLIPLYWMFLGLVATASFFRGTREWGKTER